jgi:hypothetical protein
MTGGEMVGQEESVRNEQAVITGGRRYEKSVL